MMLKIKAKKIEDVNVFIERDEIINISRNCLIESLKHKYSWLQYDFLSLKLYTNNNLYLEEESVEPPYPITKTFIGKLDKEERLVFNIIKNLNHYDMIN